MLSVVVPVYNEEATVRGLLRRVLDHPLAGEVIVVDDASRDGTREILRELERKEAPRMRLFLHGENRGKGAALRTAFAHASGDLVLVQDADLEYDPADYERLLQPFRDGVADVVYGSRYAGRARGFRIHTLGNRVLTWFSNLATGLHLTDMETCYKLFRADVLKRIPLRCDRFGFEPEITAKIAALGCRVREVPIRYTPRGYAEGKKIKWKDGVVAVAVILWCAVSGGRRGFPSARR
jgi:glycosyltransferase involved in cell wall biosynthesis